VTTARGVDVDVDYLHQELALCRGELAAAREEIETLREKQATWKRRKAVLLEQAHALAGVLTEIHESRRAGGWRRRLARMITTGDALRASKSERRDIELLESTPLFRPAWYLRHNLDVAQEGMDPVLHYLRHGGAEGRDPSPDFDTAEYLEEHPDVVHTGQNPLLHHLRASR
jgi:hypothetical protein